jgi:hypothetical protein
MFGDGGWDERRAWEQEQRLGTWMSALHGLNVVIIECGAGTAVPTVRLFCEAMTSRLRGTLVRINVREPQVPAGQIGLSMGALAGLREIDTLLIEMGQMGHK